MIFKAFSMFSSLVNSVKKGEWKLKETSKLFASPYFNLFIYFFVSLFFCLFLSRCSSHCPPTNRAPNHGTGYSAPIWDRHLDHTCLTCTPSGPTQAVHLRKVPVSKRVRFSVNMTSASPPASQRYRGIPPKTVYCIHSKIPIDF